MSTAVNCNKTYAEVLAEKCKDQDVGIIFDSDWGIRVYSEFQVNNKSIIAGEIVGAEANFLDVKIKIPSNNREYVKILSVNAWNTLPISVYDNGISQVLSLYRQALGKQ